MIVNRDFPLISFSRCNCDHMCFWFYCHNQCPLLGRPLGFLFSDLEASLTKCFVFDVGRYSFGIRTVGLFTAIVKNILSAK